MSEEIKDMFERSLKIIPKLDMSRTKGCSGRIAIVGGCDEFSGAAYITAITALKVGADVVHVICTKAAAPVIQSCSPDLLVHALLSEEDYKRIEPLLEQIDVIVFSLGLSRDPAILRIAFGLIDMCRNAEKPIVIDGDGLILRNEHIDLLKNYPSPGVILSLDDTEFVRLFGEHKDQYLDQILQKMHDLAHNVVVIRKGTYDRIYDPVACDMYHCVRGGSARRCGGQGAFLAGALATFLHWALDTKDIEYPPVLACFAASFLTRSCNFYAFKIYGRSMTCTDMIPQIHKVFKDKFKPETASSSGTGQLTSAQN